MIGLKCHIFVEKEGRSAPLIENKSNVSGHIRPAQIMYDYIKGQVAELTPTYVVIDCNGVGYYINISLQTFAQIEHDPQPKIYTHFTVREDAQLLYGFASQGEREFFRQLISVSGVGGNTARMILSTFTPAELASIISTENAAQLKQVKGLGLKTAQKIIVELRDKVAAFAAADSSGMVPITGAPDETIDEAVAALSMLGFSRAASEKMVRKISEENRGASVEEVIRLSLKRL